MKRVALATACGSCLVAVTFESGSMREPSGKVKALRQSFWRPARGEASTCGFISRTFSRVMRCTPGESVLPSDVTKPSTFPGATGFIEVPDESLRAEAFAVVRDSNGNGWAFDTEPPRPISEEEVKAKGGFRVKPEDADELVPALPA